ncbi:MAG TPA: outer membrane beta-barrel protein [Sedimentisphaerales bacterium]|nr:outer membrane beta-barrel protein [Sedimentisphaerales bacterium]
MKRGLMVLVATLVLAGVAGAAVQQGDTELDFSGAFTSYNGAEGNGNSTGLEAYLRLGYFLTDNVQAGVEAGAGWFDSDSTSSEYSSESTDYSLGIFGKYHFMPTNQWVPYVGARFGYGWMETDSDAPGVSKNTDEGVWYGPLAGLRFELNANNDFFAEYRYTLYAGDYEDVYDETHEIIVGIIHQFK